MTTATTHDMRTSLEKIKEAWSSAIDGSRFSSVHSIVLRAVASVPSPTDDILMFTFDIRGVDPNSQKPMHHSDPQIIGSVSQKAIDDLCNAAGTQTGKTLLLDTLLTAHYCHMMSARRGADETGTEVGIIVRRFKDAAHSENPDLEDVKESTAWLTSEQEKVFKGMQLTKGSTLGLSDVKHETDSTTVYLTWTQGSLDPSADATVEVLPSAHSASLGALEGVISALAVFEQHHAYADIRRRWEDDVKASIAPGDKEGEAKTVSDIELHLIKAEDELDEFLPNWTEW